MEWKILAGVRFFLAWIVFCLHLKWFLPKDILVVFSKLDAISAVLGFLVISGYSIASSISRKPEKFFYRRVLRIYPLYIIGVLVSLIPFGLLNTSSLQVKNTLDPFFVEPSLTQVIGNLFFAQGFFSDTIRSNPVLWTLSVEVACYLYAPLFIKLNHKILAALMLLSCAAYIVYPHLKLQDLFFLKFGLPFVFLFWAWMLGFLYYLHRSEFSAKVGMISIGTIAVTLAHLNIRHILAVFTFTSVCAVVVLAPHLKLNKKVLDTLNYLGDLSYPFYLIHVPCLMICYLIFHVKSSLLMAVVALLVAALLYHTVDVPLRLGKHLRRQVSL